MSNPDDHRNHAENNSGSEDELVPPRRKGLRPRNHTARKIMRKQLKSDSDYESENKDEGEKAKKNKRSRVRPRLSEDSDDDDIILVNERLDGWGSCGPSWLSRGLDMHGAASGWVHQNDNVFAASWTSGFHAAKPSSKAGGADIQPLVIEENSVSFDDIGGLSEYKDSLKEMVFFPLLYPDFFASYNITPPRGVLLCGPPGTGKTLIARALACAASKAGQKVSFYMRKGSDVLSKWVGEAERQLRLLFEEAQRHQPSIIFFDEIDGLAPVRSSKQEQTHNSVVSTLLALMDGLDSRGQVVLIGATNRVDAIDGALRRPGRFDREFHFPMPGLEARTEILDIHTRKWKQPPSKELKLELAASCVGYCGADLKALCTEAAIRAFREKYPQVYTSNDKFLIDVDSVKVDKYHFLEAMSAITPAAHRGSFVLSRPLSSVVAPCLQGQLQKAMKIVSDIFPVSAASSELTNLYMLSYGSSANLLVYRPRLLLSGDESVGLDHIGAAILHELEKFPVHSVGLLSLHSDPAAKTPEEALIHIFGEARKKTPSILYLPQFHLWWENADEQLKAVLQTLLEGLPSDLPLLLLGTSSLQFNELDESASLVFPSHTVLQLDVLSTEDRSLFFDGLIEAALSVVTEDMKQKFNHHESLSELPKASKEAFGPTASELKAKAEAQGHSLCRLRMCLRDVCNRILNEKRFRFFHYPVMDEEDTPNDPDSTIQNTMDVVTLLQRVDTGKYITSKAFLEDLDLILTNAKKHHGDDYKGERIVSRAYELRDAVYGMLSQMDPELVAFCEKIADEGGPVSIPHEFGDSAALPQTSIIQMATVTQASSPLCNAQPEVNLDQSYQELKFRPKKPSKKKFRPKETIKKKKSRPKKRDDAVQIASSIAEEASWPEDPALPKPSVECNEADRLDHQRSSNLQVDGSQHDTSDLTIQCTSQEDVAMMNGEISNTVQRIRQYFLEHTRTYGVPQLESLYTRVMKVVFETKNSVRGENLKSSILGVLFKFAKDESKF